MGNVDGLKRDVKQVSIAIECHKLVLVEHPHLGPRSVVRSHTSYTCHITERLVMLKEANLATNATQTSLEDASLPVGEGSEPESFPHIGEAAVRLRSQCFCTLHIHLSFPLPLTLCLCLTTLCSANDGTQICGSPQSRPQHLPPLHRLILVSVHSKYRRSLRLNLQSHPPPRTNLLHYNPHRRLPHHHLRSLRPPPFLHRSRRPLPPAPPPADASMHGSLRRAHHFFFERVLTIWKMQSLKLQRRRD